MNYLLAYTKNSAASETGDGWLGSAIIGRVYRVLRLYGQVHIGTTKRSVILLIGKDKQYCCTGKPHKSDVEDIF